MIKLHSLSHAVFAWDKLGIKKNVALLDATFQVTLL